MMSRLIGVLIFTFIVFPVQAQERILQAGANSNLEQLHARVDSLQMLKKNLQRQLSRVKIELERTEALLQLQQAEDEATESVILLTNMEASLRSRPSPDGRVVHILPAKTPVVALDYNGAYWKVRSEGIEGWIMRLFVDEGRGASEFKKRLLAAQGEDRKGSDFGENSLYAARQGKKFLVTDFGIHPPNSAGGISIYYAFEHLDSTKTVREVTFSITPFNEQGLKEKGMNSGTSTKRLRRFGPISVNDGEKQYQFENVWYNASIRCAQIDRIDIVYTDGARMSYRQDVGEVLFNGIANDCTITTADQVESSPGNE